ncbi:MAG: DEAD/DEAH box helicase [Sediminicola sp.]
MSTTFAQLGVGPLLQKSLGDLQFVQPTEIQQQVIPLLLGRKGDIVALARTGTGKTAAFGLPLLQLMDTETHSVQAVVLAPTRELGQQIYNDLISFSTYLPSVSVASICGGIPIKPQIERLKGTTHIVVATPGRLIDLIKRGAINIKMCQYLVLDEADEMVTSLKEGLDDIIKELPKKRRTFLFSATMPGAVKQLVNNYMSKDVQILNVGMETIGHQGIDHIYSVVEPIEKLEVLMHFLGSREGERGIIFCKTKAAVNKLAKNLAINKFSVGALHGSLAQPVRDRIMGQFREGHIHILVATDLAARGLDIKETAYVVNYHLPEVRETYVHRSGRTARAGAKGTSLTILQKGEEQELSAFQEALGIVFTPLPKVGEREMEEHNALLWAKKIFKTRPDQEISPAFRERIQTVFHHLTKEELILKILTDHMGQRNSSTLKGGN